jgi:hypothetical protein
LDLGIEASSLFVNDIDTWMDNDQQIWKLLVVEFEVYGKDELLGGDW